MVDRRSDEHLSNRNKLRPPASSGSQGAPYGSKETCRGTRIDTFLDFKCNPLAVDPHHSPVLVRDREVIRSSKPRGPEWEECYP